jgi:hypothetical protein
MNLLSLFKVKQTFLLLITLIGVGIYGVIIEEHYLAISIFVIIIISIFTPGSTSSDKDFEEGIKASMKRVLRNAANGNLEDRVTDIDEKTFLKLNLLGL